MARFYNGIIRRLNVKLENLREFGVLISLIVGIIIFIIIMVGVSIIITIVIYYVIKSRRASYISLPVLVYASPDVSNNFLSTYY